MEEQEQQVQVVVKEKVIDPEEEKRKEAEKLLQQRFKTFDLYFKDLSNLLDAWDRTQGNIFRQPSPSEKSDHDDHLTSKKKKDTKSTIKWLYFKIYLKTPNDLILTFCAYLRLLDPVTLINGT